MLCWRGSDADPTQSLDSAVQVPVPIKSDLHRPAYAEDAAPRPCISSRPDLSTLASPPSFPRPTPSGGGFAKSRAGGLAIAAACGFGHYDAAALSILSIVWKTPPLSIPDRDAFLWAQGDRRARRLRLQGPGYSFVEACRPEVVVLESLPLRVTFLIEGEGGGEDQCGSKPVCRLGRGPSSRARRRCRPRLRPRHGGTRKHRPSPGAARPPL